MNLYLRVPFFLFVVALLAAVGFGQGPGDAIPETVKEDSQDAAPQFHTQLTVTARGLEEEAQEIAMPMSVVSGQLIEKAGVFNVNRLKELIPTVQFYSSNPRNTSINIRGLGSPFGLTNDGIETGVGLYVDGVFYARPASGTFDFLDVERIEVLRGPQGTLFGKNTTAGAINVTTHRPSFSPQSTFELSYGNYGFIQAKASITGPLTRNIAGRLSFSGTQRDGLLHNVLTGDDVNDLNNLGIRGQLLITVSGKLVIRPTADYTRQRPEGYAQVVAGVAPTLRPPDRQYPAIAADLGYAPPSFNAFDRLVDTDTPWRSAQDLGGAAVSLDWDLGRGLLTSTTAWRYWRWDPSNDRDFVGLPVTTQSQAPTKHRQWTQELRYAGKVSPGLSVVAGFFTFHQALDSDPFHRTETGAAAARFQLPPSAASSTPGLLDGYGENTRLKLRTSSAAVFGQVEWALHSRWRLVPGVRLNYDRKEMDFDRQVYGGLQTTDPVLIAFQRSIFSPQSYVADVDNTNVSGQLTLGYAAAENVNVYATYANGFKSVGLNLGGVPANASGQPALDAAMVKPENVRHVEIGLKSNPLPGMTANFAFFKTSINDFQTQIVSAEVGVLRGYLANAESVRVRGAEFDGNARLRENISVYGAFAYTEGTYTVFTNAPPPLEETGGPLVKDISGSSLPGISKWGASLGGEIVKPGSLFGRRGEFFAGVDASHRSAFSSSPSASRYLIVEGYALLNGRVGFRASDNWSLYLWGRNLLDREYFDFLSGVGGNSGLYVGLPGDPRTFGITLRRGL